MPKILVIGATGYIGRALCASLVRSGNYTVYGLARSAEKARQLQSEEVIPVLGSVTENAAYLALIREVHIDLVAEVAGVRDGGLQIIEDLRIAGRERIAHAKAAGVPLCGAKLGFVYTSGIWLHGSTATNQVMNDLDPIGVEGASEPPERVRWRIKNEEIVLDASRDLDVAIVRPGVVYGGSSWIFSPFFEQLQQAADEPHLQSLTLGADENALIGLVHVEDAASALHAAIDKLPALNGTGIWPVFDIVSSTEPLAAILSQAAQALGLKAPISFKVPRGNPYEAAMSTSVRTDSGRAKTLLGWAPKRIGMLSQIDLYVRAWAANR